MKNLAEGLESRYHLLQCNHSHPEDENEEEDIDTNDEDAEEEGDANDGVYSDSEVNSDDKDPDDVAVGEESK